MMGVGLWATSAGIAALLAIVGCGSSDGSRPPPDACTSAECEEARCLEQGKLPTAIRGTVLAPNGTLPLYGALVYLPTTSTSLPPLPAGAQCRRRCYDDEILPDTAAASSLTDGRGEFHLSFVTSGDNVPLVITMGKWRRQIVIPHVEACAETVVDPALTRLPRDHTEGDLPRIAVTTGGHDALECLVKKLGIADAEVTTDAGPGRVHLFAGTGGMQGFSGGGSFPSATTLWSTAGKLAQYDLVVLSCEGAPNAGTKPQAALDAMKTYADAGGRVLASHWHNIWIGGNFTGGGAPAQPAWSSLAQWTATDGNPGNPLRVDEAHNPDGTGFADWLVHVEATGPASRTGVLPDTTRGQLALAANTGHVTATAIDFTQVQRWLAAPSGGDAPQMFDFATPLGLPIEQGCGRVAFTDVHAAAAAPGAGGYPAACSGTTTLTPQEKALAFMFFELASCNRIVELGP